MGSLPGPEFLRQRRRFLSRAGGLLLLPALVGCGGRKGPAFAPAPEDAVIIRMEGFAFVPAEASARVGQLVEWRNVSSQTHTVTADPRLAELATSVELPPGIDPFNSGRIAPSEVFRRRFQVPGTYRYTCLPHEERGMQGVLIIEA